MTLPFPKPTSRDQARANALHYAQGAQGQLWLENQRMAEMWATVALTFEDVIELEDEDALDLESPLKDFEGTINYLIKKVNGLHNEVGILRSRLDNQRGVVNVQTGLGSHAEKSALFTRLYGPDSEFVQTTLDLAEARVRAYMTGHFTDATIMGVIGALQDVPKPRG